MNWVTEQNEALLTDLYELLMAQAYWRERMTGEAVFTLFCRRLPQHRNYLIACGLDQALACLETMRFHDHGLDYLATLGQFQAEFLHWLRAFRFSGDVYAVPEGTPIFAGEPILEIVAPIACGQLVETIVMNQMHLQMVLAAKATRVVSAAAGRPVVDFGLRRAHGADAGLKGARALAIAGVAATSNVLAGATYGIPVAGTMAHSYIQAHDSEIDALRSFVQLYPDSILLVDTYDTVRGIDRVIALARELGPEFRVRGIRIDSGDLAALARDARARLDAAGLRHVQIFASGDLSEWSIAELFRQGIPIDGFGVGAAMNNSLDAPVLDMVYKLVSYAGHGRLKTSPGKAVLPGRKQIFRITEDGIAQRDVIASADEQIQGRPLLELVMRHGARVSDSAASFDAARRRCADEVSALPQHVRQLDPADPPYAVSVSEHLAAMQRETTARVAI